MIRPPSVGLHHGAGLPATQQGRASSDGDVDYAADLTPPSQPIDPPREKRTGRWAQAGISGHLGPEGPLHIPLNGYGANYHLMAVF